MASSIARVATFFDNNQVSRVLKKLHEQRSLFQFCDVILRVCSVQIFAHSNVLAAASPYFASLFGHNHELPRAFSQKMPQIIEIHIDGNEGDGGYSEAVRKVVDFMYTSSIELSFTTLTQVMEIARIMQMTKIMDFCEQFQKGSPGIRDKADIGINTNSLTQIFKMIDTATQTGDRTQDSANTLTEDDKDKLKEELSLPVRFSAMKTQENSFKRLKNENILKKQCISKRKRGRPPRQNASSESSVKVPKIEEANSGSRTDVSKPPVEGLQISPKVEKLENSENPISPKDLVQAKHINEVVKHEDENKETTLLPIRKSARLKGKKSRSYAAMIKESIYIKEEEEDGYEDQESEGSVKSEPDKQDDESSRSHFECQECSYTCDNIVLYRRHRKGEHGGGRYTCDKCSFSTARMKLLTIHKRDHLHAENRCSYCGMTVDDAEKFREHLSRHRSPNPYFCDMCDMSFKTKTQLTLHLPKHSKDKPFVCNLCSAGFKWKHALKNHMITHKTTKDHLCDVCGFSTAHRSQLKAHRLIHTGETFKCGVPGCSFQATKRQNLKYHMLTHTHEKPHQCEICGQSFSLIKNMKRHMLLHTNERPYKCEQCNFSTTRYDKLKEHYFKQHNVGMRPGRKLRLSDYQEQSNAEQSENSNELKSIVLSDLPTQGEVIQLANGEGTQTVEFHITDSVGAHTQVVTQIETSDGETLPISINHLPTGAVQLTEIQYDPNLPTVHYVSKLE
ncbi:hypothetical protein CHS0354_022702 [Potamilus streckersoni]|uniref:Uncharacterized protein n=1 Tax=Potamilus streckersoni TaxID=2493646 RepID=A0AAE0VJJ4_9BIVA|nr:hypothetical protein CHS0354_022702 [Potamilus streckersoni]